MYTDIRCEREKSNLLKIGSIDHNFLHEMYMYNLD